jgi:acetyltransferase-like isoleucine patch superfamily enzyme
MVKFLIRKLFLKIYLIGRHEHLKQTNNGGANGSDVNATIGSGTVIDPNCTIQNDLDRNRIRIGTNCLIKGYLLVYNHGGDLEIGNDCFIGQDARIWSAKKIKIGDRVLISHNVNIHDNNSHPLSSKGRHEDFVEIFRNGLRPEADYNEKCITIEDDVWIGFNSTILKGVTIGKGAIVGACTLVTDNVPDFAVVAGNPARIIKYTN